MEYRDLLEALISGKTLEANQAQWLMSQTMSGQLTPAQIAAWVAVLRQRDETSDEIATFAKVMRANAVSLREAAQAEGAHLPETLVDTCGTGGDKANLMNISTLSALVLAARGIAVAKHGNKAVSSSCGSADILEALGYPLNETPAETARRIAEKKFGFMFAPAYHPAMKYAGPVRKELGIRTVFNILGPLSNPAEANIHLLGVFDARLLDLMAEALFQLGVKNALVVHSADGLDEISPVQATHYVEVNNGQFLKGEVNPAALNLSLKNLDEIRVANRDEALKKADSVLEGSFQAGVEAVALNAVAVEYLVEAPGSGLQAFLQQKLPEVISFIGEGKARPVF